MEEQQQPLDALQDIKRMMERSSRFISLSGLSGISAGVCALVGAWFARQRLMHYTDPMELLNSLLWIATLTFIGAFLSAFFFTFLHSKKTNTPMWGLSTRRLFWNTAIPLAVGGIFLLKMMEHGEYRFVSPGCLIFYGLALVNASKYTLGEVRYLGYGQIMLGIVNLWQIGYGVEFWAMGFGVLHIAYGIMMWYKYERSAKSSL